MNTLSLQHQEDLRLSKLREAEEQAMKDSIRQVEQKRIEQANAIKAAQEKKEREHRAHKKAHDQTAHTLPSIF